LEGDRKMSERIRKIAKMVQALTYDEMIEIAEWFSGWTAIDENGKDQEKTIDQNTMAANLSDWATNQVNDHE
jgi:hypothetical protein